MTRQSSQARAFPWNARLAQKAVRDLVALVAAQVLCALLARRLLVGLGQAPLAALSDFSVVALFALVLGVALLAAARHRLAYSAVLGAGCTLASLHCFLLAVNVPFVNVIGGPLTFQWLYLSDFFRTQTPWQSASAAATRLSIAFCLLGPLLPPTALWLVRKVKPLGSIAGDRAMGLAMAPS